MHPMLCMRVQETCVMRCTEACAQYVLPLKCLRLDADPPLPDLSYLIVICEAAVWPCQKSLSMTLAVYAMAGIAEPVMLWMKLAPEVAMYYISHL